LLPLSFAAALICYEELSSFKGRTHMDFYIFCSQEKQHHHKGNRNDMMKHEHKKTTKQKHKKTTQKRET